MSRTLNIELPPLHAGQLEVVRSPARFKVLAAGRRWRKTSLGVQLVLATGLEGGRAWWVGPTYPVARIGWSMLRGLCAQIPGAEVRESEHLLTLPGGGEVQVRSADNPDGLRGAGLDGVAIDEAAYVQQEAWTEALRPALSDRRGWALFISTPNGFNWFYELFEAAGRSPGWARWQRPTWDNPHIAPEEIEQARREVGEVVFAQEYGAEFIDIGTTRPFRPEWVLYYGAPHDEPEPNLSELDIRIGVDPAISQRDTAARTALVVAGQRRSGLGRGNIYVLMATAGHWSVYEQVDHILKAVRQWTARRVLIEDVAYQRALGSVLDHEARIRGISVHVELVKPDSDKLRRALGWSDLVEQGRVLFGPGQSELIDAMLKVPADETKWDLVDAAGLCIRSFPRLPGETAPVPGQEVSKPDRAAGYATKVPKPPAPPRASNPLGQVVRDQGMRRAAGYAVRVRRPRKPAGVGV